MSHPISFSLSQAAASLVFFCTHFLVRRDALDSARRGAVAWRRNRALVSTKFASWFPLAIDPGH